MNLVPFTGSKGNTPEKLSTKASITPIERKQNPNGFLIGGFQCGTGCFVKVCQHFPDHWRQNMGRRKFGQNKPKLLNALLLITLGNIFPRVQTV